jgi:hypothetical protein
VKNANLKRGDHFTKERLMYNSTPLSICWTIPLKRSATLHKAHQQKYYCPQNGKWEIDLTEYKIRHEFMAVFYAFRGCLGKTTGCLSFYAVSFSLVHFLKWMNTNKDICIYGFLSCFNSAIFLLLKDDEIFTRLSLKHKELISAEMFRLHFMVLET